MSRSFTELPDWVFEIEEVSAGVYEVTGTDKCGRRVQSKGTDPDILLEDCRKFAISVSKSKA